MAEFIAIFGADGFRRALKGKQSLENQDFKLATDEVALRIQVEIPPEVFEPRPIPTVVIRPKTGDFVRNLDAEVKS